MDDVESKEKIEIVHQEPDFKRRNRLARDGYKRPTAQEYEMFRLEGISKIERLVDMARDIDARLEDAARMFDRYQKRAHGSIGISFRENKNRIYPSVVMFYFGSGGGSFRVLRLTDDEVTAWNLDKWAKHHRNPGKQFKAALRAIRDLMIARREVMAGITGRPNRMAIDQLKIHVDATCKTTDEKLDELVQNMVYDWERGGEPIRAELEHLPAHSPC
jgi:hypothetical protein